jgi:hypothetical protein
VIKMNFQDFDYKETFFRRGDSQPWVCIPLGVGKQFIRGTKDFKINPKQGFNLDKGVEL